MLSLLAEALSFAGALAGAAGNACLIVWLVLLAMGSGIAAGFGYSALSLLALGVVLIALGSIAGNIGGKP